MSSGTPQQRLVALNALIAAATPTEISRSYVPSKAAMDTATGLQKTAGALTPALRLARLQQKQQKPV